MATVLDLVKHYQHAIEKYPNDEQKILKSIDKLFNLDVTVSHLQETGVGRTVNALRKEAGDVGHAARALVSKWKLMVASEESDQDGDHNTDTTTYNGHENGRDSDDNIRQHSRSKYDSYEKSTVKVKTEPNGNYSGGKRKHQSSEDEEPDIKKNRGYYDDKTKPVQIKREPSATDDESDNTDHSHSEDSDSDASESSRDEDRKVKIEIKQEPTDNHKSSSRHSSSHKSSEDHKRESSSSKRSHDSEKHSKRHHSSEPNDRQSADKSSSQEKSHSSHKHKSSKEKEKSDKSSKLEGSSSEKDKRQREDHKTSIKHKSSSDKHKSSHSDNSSEKHKSDQEKHTSKSDKHRSSSHSHKSEKDKNKSSSEKEISDEKHKSRHSSSSKEKHSSSSKERSKDRSSSSKEKTNGSKESHSHKSEKSSADGKSKHKSDRHGDGSNETKSKNKSSSSSSHRSKSSSSKSKEDVPKNNKQATSSADSDDGIDCESGASFAEALGMVSPAKPKKKTASAKEAYATNTSITKDLSPASLLAPSAKLPPLAALPLEISALPDISPNYKPRPPPKLMPHFTDEEALSSVISSKNQRTKVYSGNKVIGKIPTLYEMCVQILQEHIDALEYTGGVPYDILKPVVDRATPQQLFVLEHFNPYLMEDTDHLWQKFCQKNFRNKQRQEMETWREMYIRCQDEQEHRLKSLTANIRMTQEAKKAPIKQTKMAYVDSVVKPPRNIARKQAQHGTAHAASASPAARVASLAAAPNVLRGNTRPTPSAPVSASSFNKPKKAPLMQKALQFMRGRKR